MLLTFVLLLCFIILCFVLVKSKICSVRWNTISFFSIQISFCSWYEYNTCWLGNNTHVGIRLNSIYLIGGALETSSSDDMFAAILNLIWWQKLLLSLHEEALKRLFKRVNLIENKKRGLRKQKQFLQIWLLLRA